jgi:hypothetical protein
MFRRAGINLPANEKSVPLTLKEGSAIVHLGHSLKLCELNFPEGFFETSLFFCYSAI